MKKKKLALAGLFLLAGFLFSVYLFNPGEPPVEPEIAPPSPVASMPDPVVKTRVPEQKEEPPPAPAPLKKKPRKKRSADTTAGVPLSVEEEPLQNPRDEQTEYEQNQFFESLVMGSFPVHTVQTYNPLKPDRRGPPPGEIWVRIKPDNAREMNEIMSEVADLYKDITQEYQDKEVAVMHWVGAQPYARHVYAPDGTMVR